MKKHDAIAVLKEQAEAIKALGATALYLFGSTARDQANYAITGDDPPWRPVRAFDDGNKVYIEFPKRIDQGDAPPLFVIGADGGTELVNYRMRGNYYVVDKLFAAAELRLGEDKQQIVRITRTDGKPQNAASIFGG